MIDIEKSLSTEINWVNEGAVTPVKNQGNCGSCWAFSATGALEGVSAIDAGDLQSFSEQQLIDCEKQSHGCNGGNKGWALGWVAENGIVTEDEYPYTAQDGQCTIDSGPFKIQDYFYVKNDCNSVAAALQQQPIAVSVFATDAWQSYSSGILHFEECPGSTNHAVLLVGMASENYWIVKNSWGTSWGEEGYINLAWGDNSCICEKAILTVY